MLNLFEAPIRTRKVRKGIFAYQYPNGVIVVQDQKYILYSMTEAIKLYRSQFPRPKA